MSNRTAVQTERVQSRNTQPIVAKKPVLYWMQRDQRAEDNWALLYAMEQAQNRQVPLLVVFNVVPTFGGATWRQYDFMLKGLKEVAADLGRREIPFWVLVGDPVKNLKTFVSKYEVGEVVMDQNPMREPQRWRTELAAALPVRVTEVDAHNIVPSWWVSDKVEFAAHTLRPKIHRALAKFLYSLPPLAKHTHCPPQTAPPIGWDEIYNQITAADTVLPVSWCTPGTQAGKLMVRSFIDSRLEYYNDKRNDPNAAVVSQLSPYLHFGQLSAQWVADIVQQIKSGTRANRDAFLEELIVRRELSDNFCRYNPQYDTVAGAYPWAQQTLAEHADDSREYIYTKQQFETAETHDELWNAMQRQMVAEGKMHGWCRMYWAKKILEWTPSASEAIKIALYLNDKYELDGNDPNGVVGVMWSICGVHDRAWTERPVFGKIRYMNYAGAKRKFAVQEFIDRYSSTADLFKTHD